MTVEKRILSSGHKISEKLNLEHKNAVFSPENAKIQAQIDLFPELFPYEPNIRTSPATGQIYIGSWREKTVGDEKQKHYRWSEFQNISSAIRVCQTISEKYENSRGEENEKVRDVTKFVSATLPSFRNGAIDRDNLSFLQGETADFLSETGYERSKVKIKHEINQQINNALSLDSLGRFNPLISRTRLASSWLKLMKELVVNQKKYAKYQRLGNLLKLEDYFETQGILQASSFFEEIYKSKNEIDLSEDDNNTLVSELKNICNENLGPNAIKVSPYFGVANIVRNILFFDESTPKEFADPYIDRPLVSIDVLNAQKMPLKNDLRARLVLSIDFLQSPFKGENTY